MLLHSIAVELTAAAHSVSWIARGGSEVTARLEASGQHVLHQLRGRGSNIGDWFATIRALRQWVPDVLILNDTHAVPLVGSAAWFARSPRPLRLAYKHTVFPLRSKLKYQLLADKIVCVSAAARDTLLHGGLNPKQSLVIYGGCHPPVPNPELIDKLRCELGVSIDHRMMVSVGSLLGCKGHADLIQAMPQIIAEDGAVRLVIAGQGEEQENLERLIKNLKLQEHVRLLGYRADAEQLLAAADLVVHPSHAEGLSLVLIQAQMLNKPIVATAVGGTVEVLDVGNPAHCTSWIAEPHNPASLAAQIRQALETIRTDSESLQARLRQTASRARQLFDVHKNTKQLSDHCARLITGGATQSQRSVSPVPEHLVAPKTCKEV